MEMKCDSHGWVQAHHFCHKCVADYLTRIKQLERTRKAGGGQTMTWCWQREGDALVIRDEPSDEEWETPGGYVAEIDIRYLTPDDREIAENIADRIIGAENRRLYNLEANAAAWAKAKAKED